MMIQENDYAIVIGISHYPDFKSLRGPKRDVHLFNEWLIDTNKGGGVPENNIEIIVSTLEPLSPIHVRIDQSLTNLYQKINRATQPARRLYFYFSGHGFGNEEMSVALALANWKKFGMRNSALKSDAYLQEFINWGKFTEVIFFLDCCRSPLHINPLTPSVGYGINENAPNVGRFIAFSSRHLNAAYEANFSDNNLDDDNITEEYNGIFTKVLMDALWGDASSNGEGVTASNLQNYLNRYVKLEANRKQKPQRPDIYNGLINDSVFGAARNVAKIKISFKPERSGTIQLLNPNLDVFLESDVSSSNWEQLELPKGSYTLVELSTKNELNFKAIPSNTINTIIF